MPKRAVLKVVKVNYTPSAPWIVRVPEQLQKIEAAKKKFFGANLWRGIQQDNASRRYLADLRSKVGRFVAAHESRLTCDVTAADIEHWIRSISRAVASDKVVDVFAAAGLKRPDISILSDQFLSDVRGLPQKNLAVELCENYS